MLDDSPMSLKLCQTTEALRALLTHYIALANSGDAGFWDPETENIVILCRLVLSSPDPY